MEVLISPRTSPPPYYDILKSRTRNISPSTNTSLGTKLLSDSSDGSVETRIRANDFKLSPGYKVNLSESTPHISRASQSQEKIRNGNISQTQPVALRNSVCFPVLFASDDEECPFLSPTSVSSVRLSRAPVLSNLSKCQPSERQQGAVSGCGSDWRPLSETPLHTSTNPHIPQGDQSKSPDQTFQFAVTVNPLTEGLVGSVSCYLNDVELEEGREEYLKSPFSAELRREISGLSQLASEFYTASHKSDEADRESLDSLHERVLLRCETKYQTPDKASNANRFFVIFTSILILLGITYSFWLKNFSSFSLN